MVQMSVSVQIISHRRIILMFLSLVMVISLGCSMIPERRHKRILRRNMDN